MADMVPQAGTQRGEDAPAFVGVADLRYDDLPATADQLPWIRHALSAWAHNIGMSADHVNAVVLATYEAMANVVTHAYPQYRGTFCMHASYRSDQRCMTITVSDRGHWQPPAPAPHHGMGLQLIRALATQTTIDSSDRGTTVEMSWSLPRLAPPVLG